MRTRCYTRAGVCFTDTSQKCYIPPLPPSPGLSLVQVEASGSEGNVDEAQSLMRHAEQLKRDKERMLEKKVCALVCIQV